MTKTGPARRHALLLGAVLLAFALLGSVSTSTASAQDCATQQVQSGGVPGWLAWKPGRRPKAELRRYALETMYLSYDCFLQRKADFVANGCLRSPAERRARRERCDKPFPYNNLTWTDDGCSVPSALPAGDWSSLFNGACQQHDFGYRNLGNGLKLYRKETVRKFVDGRFYKAMTTICQANFSYGPALATCYVARVAFYKAVRLAGDGYPRTGSGPWGWDIRI